VLLDEAVDLVGDARRAVVREIGDARRRPRKDDVVGFP
jgi:hypothetical protein